MLLAILQNFHISIYILAYNNIKSDRWLKLEENVIINTRACLNNYDKYNHAINNYELKLVGNITK